MDDDVREDRVRRMTVAIILAGGVGQRMRNAGLPKQFLKLFGKPIIIYTLEKFQSCTEIDKIVVVCKDGYLDYMKELLEIYHIHKAERVVVGGGTRQSSLHRGMEAAEFIGCSREDVVLIHDGVRPLVSMATIRENVRVAREYGCAITVYPATESVLVSDGRDIRIDDFKKRSETYSLSSPQSFRLGNLLDAFSCSPRDEYQGMPLLDAGMVYSSVGGEVHLVKEHAPNIKITTPEDFYYLRAMLELEENRVIFGL